MKPLVKYILKWADNAFIMSYRLSEYCSNGPFLEEDLAISNVALDYLGQAESLYNYAAEIQGEGQTADDLAYGRSEQEFINCQLAEQPNTDFAYIMVRQFLYDCFNFEANTILKDTADETIAAIAAKSLKEITYHLRRSSEWMIRLGQGTETSHNKMQDALNNLWKYSGEFFEMDDTDRSLLKNNIAIDLKPIKEKWDNRVKDILTKANLEIPTNNFMVSGGRKGIHTEHMGFILAQMQFLPRAYPDAKW